MRGGGRGDGSSGDSGDSGGGGGKKLLRSSERTWRII